MKQVREEKEREREREREREKEKKKKRTCRRPCTITLQSVKYVLLRRENQQRMKKEVGWEDPCKDEFLAIKWK